VEALDMAESMNQPICRELVDTQKLVASFPPNLRDRNKKAVYRIACPSGCVHGGQLVFSRWPAMDLPERALTDHSRTLVEPRQDGFGYEPTSSSAACVEWYLNFAHSDLFCAYGGAAFAQDEIQVAEHPALGSLREALLDSTTIKPLTVENGQPTPILIRGVERRCAVATDRNESEGRPQGLYGNVFSRAKPDVVERATRLIDPPTISNLIAMEAPSYGNGVYSQNDIEYIERTAFTGFRAAVIESGQASVVIHTGFWGCGAYGGNRILMALLQVLAARLAGIDRLVFHTFDQAGSEAFSTAEATMDRLWPSAESGDVRQLLAQIQALGLRWGTSDGN
jgi:hypothetical protein